MPFVAAQPGQFLLVQRSPSLIRGCIFIPTLLLGLLFVAGATRGILRHAHLLRGRGPDASAPTLGFVLVGGLLMALFAAFGATGRSEVVIDTARRVLTVTLYGFGMPLRRREHAFASFDRVELQTGVGRSTPQGPAHRFSFVALRGPSTSVSLERTDAEGASQQARQVAGWLGVPLS